mgnify:CR=1 FL=1
MFLIDDDHAESLGGNGSEDRAACTQHDVRSARRGQRPLLVPLGLGESRVQDSDAMIGKAADQSTSRLGREGDFGDQYQGDLAPVEYLLDETDVDLRLSRAGDSQQQMGGESVSKVASDGI